MRLLLIKLAKYLMIPIGMISLCFHEKPPFLILMYHRVNDGVLKEMSVKEDDFRWQMAYLKRKGYEVVTIDEALRLDGRETRRAKTVVLTFDDGYRDFYTNARPELDKYSYPALVYLVPCCLESKNTFWWDRDVGESPLMDWQQILSLSEGGLTLFGSHSMTHPDFDHIGPAEAKEELRSSQTVLQKKLGGEIRHFAYPRGIVGYVQDVGTVYDTAVAIFDGYDGAHSRAPDYRLRLKRLPVQRSDGRLLFTARLRGWLEPEGWVKALLRRH